MKRFRKIVKKFSHAFKGITLSIREEKSMMVHAIIAIVVIITGFWMKIDRYDWFWVIMIIGFVITVELFNTAIEGLVDLFEFKYNVSAGKIKDICAGATFVSVVTSIVLGLIIFIPYIIER